MPVVVKIVRHIIPIKEDKDEKENIGTDTK
jgi:hypothetical protein